MPRAIELAGTEHHEFVTAEGKAYTLDVGLPPDYESDSDVTYPVLYVLDGELMFHHVRSSYELLDTLPLTVGVPVEALEQGGFIGTPLIIVGIDQKGSHSGRASVASARESGSMRTFDLTPTRSTKQEARFLESYGRESPTGGAASFLAALKDEIFPWVASRYRASDQRGLYGFSLGGLFATHVLLMEQRSTDISSAVHRCGGTTRGSWISGKTP